MKKYLILFLVLLLPLASAFASGTAQVANSTALNVIMMNEHIQTAMRYAQQVKEWAGAAQHMIQQVQHWKGQIEQYVQNIKSATDIRSWDDFTSWMDKQNFVTDKSQDLLNKLNIKIGDKSYSLNDISGLMNSFDSKLKEYWNMEFSEEDIKSLWMGMGLTPGNYAYLQTFKEKQQTMAEEFFFASDIQNEWYVRNMERNKERQDRLAQDKSYGVDDSRKMGELEVLQLMLESSMESNKVLNDMAMNQAFQLEMQSAEYYIDQLQYDSPVLSDWSNKGFKALPFDSKY